MPDQRRGRDSGEEALGHTSMHTIILLTVWLCLASQPHCQPTEDPTGPPSVAEAPGTIELCEAYIKQHIKLAPPPKGMIGRHICMVKGDEI
jgi:hypothetical protein